MEPELAAVIFDLGGVIVELGPLEELFGPVAPDPSDFWPRWLHSPAVRDFEGGRIDAADFSERLVDELDLPMSPGEFGDRFRDWPRGLLDGAEALLTELAAASNLVVGALSNSNPVHWYEQTDAARIRGLFERPYLSFEMQLIKPDPEIYEYVASDLGVEPHRILYFDDNQINVDGARAAGWQAEVANGPAACRTHLNNIGLL